MTATTPTRPAVPARRRPTTWLALALFALALAMVGFMLASAVLPGHEQLAIGITSATDLVGVVASLGAFLGIPLVGTVLAVLRPANPIGWVLIVGGTALIFDDFGSAYVERSIELRSNLPGYQLVDWVSPMFTVLAFPLLTVWLPLLFPDGRLPGPRWRPIGLVAAVTTVTVVISAFFAAYGGEYGRMLPNPIAGGELAELVAGIAVAVNGALLVAAIAAVVVRYRRSQGAERQQMKWFVAAVALVGASMVPLAVFQDPWTWALTMLALASLSVAIGVAVLRYRLYEIDRVISRTIGWVIVTLLLVGAFAGIVLGSSAVLDPVTSGNTLAVAGATLVVAALFAPLRSRVQRAVDRRFDRARYDGERLLGAFGERLRDEVDREAIRADVLGTVDQAVRPAGVGLWLRDRGGVTR